MTFKLCMMVDMHGTHTHFDDLDLDLDFENEPLKGSSFWLEAGYVYCFENCGI